jgi:hypothetical protein
MPPLVVGDLIYIGPAAGARRQWMDWRVSTERWRAGLKFNIIPQDGEPEPTLGVQIRGAQHVGALGRPSRTTPKKVSLCSRRQLAPDFYDDARPGINLYTNSDCARWKDRKLLWYNQLIPYDVDDYDTTHVNPIFSKFPNRSPRQGKTAFCVVDGETHNLCTACRLPRN